LAKNVDGKLFFAGEATTRTHPATAAGAYMSGLAQCGDIATLLDEKIVRKMRQ
jgi:lysine-specific histone demethylase 1